ncbi:hypothetical protein APE_2315 [Aeropyrum pernix K1]|uniref:Uncharacterized protein n=1 Tax=Aeropyrum pernix (strain ATCC 700893 / DSM 11879 / JCM 9820 / NBRC 100138 / K1) TaxID=272557 RepID=Q9Y9H3_AERPE|nr:hypothetical protein [Aeropyrum pernix]BAA81327.1 hypothetical protein APE_2315 [Aeropyrum pernix K1]
MRILELFIFASGLLLTAIAAAPLYDFAADVNEGAFQLDYYERGGALVVRLEYSGSVELSGARLIIIADGQSYQGGPEDLGPGGYIEVELPPGAAESVEDIVFEARIAGLYRLRLDIGVETAGG